VADAGSIVTSQESRKSDTPGIKSGYFCAVIAEKSMDGSIMSNSYEIHFDVKQRLRASRVKFILQLTHQLNPSLHQRFCVKTSLEQLPGRGSRLAGDTLLAHSDNLHHIPLSLSEMCASGGEWA